MTTPASTDIFADLQKRLRDARVESTEIPAVRIASALVLFREGLAGEGELLDYLAQLGADPLQRDRLLFSAQLDRKREIAEGFRAALVPLLAKAEISQSELTAALVRVGYTADAAALIVELAAFRAGMAPAIISPIPAFPSPASLTTARI